ncbi:MAG: hypothetical protein PHQ55_08950 [Eubacteriales bacterium]|jgi:hypothetical protein|nr:hypothetical protein [Eubacteriales bacterium]MDD3198180.1 hypothetical protein [Eubacteriales bacterium]MDD3504460.1 hypothetical protein [Eubacteriales bacterium]MDD4683280.1 hypothetical protein [Eubacteriales bacterium]
MRVKIGRKVYDTEKYPEVARKVVGYFGDSYGYEEIMFHKKDKEFFLYGIGGDCSVYKEPQIRPLDEQETDIWLEELLGRAEADKLLNTFTSKKTTAASRRQKK